MRVTPGVSYRVLVAGASLSGWQTVSQQGGAYYEQATRRQLAVGDVIVCDRYGYSGGSDEVTIPFFRLADGSYTGTFYPSGPYGAVRPGALEEVSASATPPPPAKAKRKRVKKAASKACEHQPIPYTSDGALGHGWECSRCGELLQVG